MGMDTFFVVMSSGLLIILVLLIPLMVQIWRSLRQMAATLDTINRKLPLILQNIEEIAITINKTAKFADSKFESIVQTLGMCKAVFSLVGGLKPIFLRHASLSLIGKIRLVGAFFKGVKVFIAYLKQGKSSDLRARKNGNYVDN